MTQVSGLHTPGVQDVQLLVAALSVSFRTRQIAEHFQPKLGGTKRSYPNPKMSSPPSDSETRISLFPIRTLKGK
jgi:hypothetical protein